MLNFAPKLVNFTLMKHLSTAFLALSTLFVCSACGSDDPEPAKETCGRTIIVYMAAENNLSSYAQENIDDMIKGAKSLASNDRLLVFVDRNSKTEKPFIMRLTGNEAQPTDTLYKYSTDFYSSDAGKMKEVLAWCMENYPSESYGLVLWGHADGWMIHTPITAWKNSVRKQSRAFGWDTGDDIGGSDNWMEIADMRDALAALPHDFKFIFADCCAFQSVEVAYELRNVTDYIVASPAEIPGAGAPYETVIPAMYNRSDVSMCRQLCDLYNEDGGTGNRVAISAVDTDKLDDLADATNEVIVNALNGKTFNMDGLVYYFNNVNMFYPAERIMYDMMDFMRQNTDGETFQKWKQAYDAAVIYKRMSTQWDTAALVNFKDFTVTGDNFGGMSMFVPLERYNTTVKNYNTLIKQTSWYNAAGWASIGW